MPAFMDAARRALGVLAFGVAAQAIGAVPAAGIAASADEGTAIAGLDSGSEPMATTDFWFAAPLANALQAGVGAGEVRPWQASVSFVDGIGTELLRDAPDWLRRSELDWSVDEVGQLRFDLTSSRLVDMPLDLAGFGLVQSSMAYDDWTRGRGSIGVGYRRLFDDSRWLVGVNAFYDYARMNERERVSLGGQLKTAAFEIRGNYYLPTSPAATGTALPVVLSGYDLEAALQLPYLPWADAYAASDGWESPSMQDDGFVSRSAGLRLSPWPFLALSGEVVDDGGTEPFYAMSFRVNIAFGTTDLGTDRPLFDDQPFRFQGISPSARQQVFRENTIRLGQGG